MITASILKLYVFGSFARLGRRLWLSRRVGERVRGWDRMSKKGWHLDGPAAVHIACKRLTFQVMETLTSDLKVSVTEAKNAPEGKGTTVVLYGEFLSFCRATLYASLTLY